MTDGKVTVAAAEDTFCTVAGAYKCTVDRMSWGKCNKASYSSALLSQFQYFPGDASAGGSLETADYCPFYNSLSNRVCTNPLDAPTAPKNFQGQVYSALSRCFESTLNQAIDGYSASGPVLGCYDTECTTTDDGKTHRLIIRAKDKDGVSREAYCDAGEAGAAKTMPGDTFKAGGTVKCPDDVASWCTAPPPIDLTPTTTPTPAPSPSSGQQATGGSGTSTTKTPSGSSVGVAVAPSPASTSAEKSPTTGAGTGTGTAATSDTAADPTAWTVEGAILFSALASSADFTKTMKAGLVFTLAVAGRVASSSVTLTISNMRRRLLNGVRVQFTVTVASKRAANQVNVALTSLLDPTNFASLVARLKAATNAFDGMLASGSSSIKIVGVPVVKEPATKVGVKQYVPDAKDSGIAIGVILGALCLIGAVAAVLRERRCGSEDNSTGTEANKRSNITPVAGKWAERREADDGEAYTRNEFIAHFGGTEQWDAAVGMDMETNPMGQPNSPKKDTENTALQVSKPQNTTEHDFDADEDTAGKDAEEKAAAAAAAAKRKKKTAKVPKKSSKKAAASPTTGGGSWASNVTAQAAGAGGKKAAAAKQGRSGKQQKGKSSKTGGKAAKPSGLPPPPARAPLKSPKNSKKKVPVKPDRATPTVAEEAGEKSSASEDGGDGDHTHRSRLIRFYREKAPLKLASVDDTLARFQENEGAMWANLLKKYGPSQYEQAAGKPRVVAEPGGDAESTPERRLADDGSAYTLEEFISHFGSTTEWDAAAAQVVNKEQQKESGSAPHGDDRDPNTSLNTSLKIDVAEEDAEVNDDKGDDGGDEANDVVVPLKPGKPLSPSSPLHSSGIAGSLRSKPSPLSVVGDNDVSR